VDDVQCAVFINNVNDLHKSSASAATDDQQLVIRDLLGEWRANRLDNLLCLLWSYTVPGRVIQIPVVPAKSQRHAI